MNGKLLVISGLSGAGKGTIAQMLVDKFDNYKLSISATTRDKRAGEIDGVHYFFVSTDKFKEMIEGGELLEYAKYVDNYYGTPKKYVMDNLNNGINVILEIEMQGALHIKEILPEALLIFYTLKDAKTQRERLIGRGRENEEQIEKRLAQAKIDAGYAKFYDYVVVNDKIEDTLQNTIDIVNGKYDLDKKIKNKNLEVLNQFMKS